MSLLKKMGFGAKSAVAVVEPKPIKLHPDCMKVHSVLVSSWLAGSHISVLNPNTDEWEDCPNPIFDPAIRYRFTPVAPIPAETIVPATWEVPVPSQPAPAPVPINEVVHSSSVFVRGDVWQSNNGYTYLVLGNKATLLADYNPRLDPDSGPIVVMRIDTGKKQAVSCRSAYGNRSDNNYEFTLDTRKRGFSGLSGTAITGDGRFLLIAERDNASNVYLDTRTGEIKFFN